MNLKKRRYCFLVLSLLAGLGTGMGCSTESMPVSHDADSNAFSARTLPIFNGERVTGNNELSTVGLTVEVVDGFAPFCTGTLIAPEYVLTAAHCISECNDGGESMAGQRDKMRISIGQSRATFRANYEIESFHPHPQFVCESTYLKNDIAILKLKEKVDVPYVVPTPPLPPSLALTTKDVDSEKGITMTVVGFGRTEPAQKDSKGSKYKTSLPIYALCPLEGTGSKNCGNQYTKSKGFFYYDVTTHKTGTCEGDSGGPSFITKNGNKFVAGVTSFGQENCQHVSAMTDVSEYYDFIVGIVPDVISDQPEDCTNGKDDNNDKRIDCDDPWCFAITECLPEDCSNHIDDNNNGYKDCDDAACSEDVHCQKEICDNLFDDNLNGLMDCDDPQCSKEPGCRKEICDNNIDDDKDGSKDCDDIACSDEVICQNEICNNKIDDNENGYIDCEDPGCADDVACKKEICDNEVDDNENGYTDCNDPDCAKDAHCQKEICDNDKDDNANGLSDCDDPDCADQELCKDKPQGPEEPDAPDKPEPKPAQPGPGEESDQGGSGGGDCAIQMYGTGTPGLAVLWCILLGAGMILRRKKNSIP